VDALKSARGNRAKAARLLGTTERIIGYKIRKYDIEVARFRGAPSLSAARRRTGIR
jgi:Nif-specific regulatory protein